jgi:hypothetical protein
MQYRRRQVGLNVPEISLRLWHNSAAPRRSAVARDRPPRVRARDHPLRPREQLRPPYGSAEGTFGQILRKDLAGHRDEIVVSTKAGTCGAGPYGDGAAPPRVPSRSCPADRADVGAIGREPLHHRNFDKASAVQTARGHPPGEAAAPQRSSARRCATVTACGRRASAPSRMSARTEAARALRSASGSTAPTWTSSNPARV